MKGVYDILYHAPIVQRLDYHLPPATRVSLRVAVGFSHFPRDCVRPRFDDVVYWVKLGLLMLMKNSKDVENLWNHIQKHHMYLTGSLLTWSLLGFPDHWKPTDIDVCYSTNYDLGVLTQPDGMDLLPRVAHLIHQDSDTTLSDYCTSNTVRQCCTFKIKNCETFLQFIRIDPQYTMRQHMDTYDFSFCRFAIGSAFHYKRNDLLDLCLNSCTVDLKRCYMLRNFKDCCEGDNWEKFHVPIYFTRVVPMQQERIEKYEARGFTIVKTRLDFPNRCTIDKKFKQFWK